jgi:DNA polymerase-3 subunit alpha
MHGAEIRRPCVNNSTALCVIKGQTIWLGLAMVAELEENSILQLLVEREKNGLYAGLTDFIQRNHLSLEQMRILIRAGAFEFTGKDKKTLLWEVHMTMGKATKKEVGPELFKKQVKTFQLPELVNSVVDEAYDDIELLGFTMCSPFDMLKDTPPPTILSRDFKDNIQKVVEVLGYMISIKYVRTSKGERMYFGTFIDKEGLWIDTVHFPPSAKQYPFSGPGCYWIKGKVVEEYDFLSIEVMEMKRLAVVNLE